MLDSVSCRIVRLASITVATCAAGLLVLACSDQGAQTPATPTAKPSAPAPATPNATPSPAASPPEPASPAELAKRGRSIYMSNCIACHGQDPAQDGALGPAVTGSSRALLEARVLRGEYPEGYAPKRESRVMIPLPHLEGELDALTAFLNAGS